MLTLKVMKPMEKCEEGRPIIRRLGRDDVVLLREMNALFAREFADPESYANAPPSDEWVSEALAKDHIIAIAALAGGALVGGLIAYEFDKLERARRETYIYDLAVAASYRRQGLATAMIEAVRQIAADRKAWVMFVQADYGDDAAVALYTKLGAREDVMHFDIGIGASA